METNNYKSSNTLSEIWDFFIPPILNAVVILIVFPNIPKIIWGGFAYAISQLRTATHSDTALSSLPDLLSEITKNSSLLGTISESAGAALISAIVTLAILIIVLHQAILITTKIICGKIDLSEESLENHPVIGRALARLEPFIPDEGTYSSVHRRWEYARSVNDTQNNLSIYRYRRNKIISQIETNRSFATYASAYFLLSAISLIFINFSLVPVFTLLATIGFFLLFSRRYIDACTKLADLDIYTFLAVANHDKEETKNIEEDETASPIKSRFTSHIIWFKGNIFATVIYLTKGIKNSLQFKGS